MNFRITNGSVSFGAETILEEINFEVKGKEKVAIVGRNGAGKSTLLNAIINNEMLTEGIGEDKFNIYKEGNPKIGYLKQIDFEDDSITMIDEILKVYQELIDIEKKLDLLVLKMNESSNESVGLMNPNPSRVIRRSSSFSGDRSRRHMKIRETSFEGNMDEL